MGYRTVTVDVDVYVDDVINEADDQELIDQLESRGYTCVKDDGAFEVFDKYDWLQLQEIIERLPRSWETERLRDKVVAARMH
jgi:hypothetical protein